MPAHPLDSLLRPRSMALVGASARPGTVGNVLVRQLVDGGFGGAIYPVNPRYETVEGIACHPALDALPGPVDHVVLAVANARIEDAFERAVRAGARAATIIASLFIPGDGEPPLAARIRGAADEAGVLLCGGNCMGFYNFHDRVRVCGYPTRTGHRAGPAALISHSGSVFAALADCDERLDFNLMVSAGQELNVSAADYLDFALEQPGTRVVGLFLETVRDPEALVAALAKANARGVPVVALKVGRTAFGARMAASHSGALAGDDKAYDAVFERYGVARVETVDELATALIMFAQPHPVGPGGLATLHDSGGERALTIDLAARLGVRFAAPAPATTAALEDHLEPGLPAVNPLDAWGTGHDYADIYGACFAALMRDPDTALGAMVGDRGPGGTIYDDYPGLLRTAHAAGGKPVFLVSNHQGTGGDSRAVALTREGFPVIDGLGLFLAGVKHLFAYRDFRARPAARPPALPDGALAAWRARLAAGPGPDEAEALALIARLGIPANPATRAESRDAALRAAAAHGYPVALKAAGVAHKSDADGVALDLADAAAVAAAYDDLATRLGPAVVVAPMVAGGVAEVILGVSLDSQFGPLVVIGIGGVDAEALGDAVCGLPPFDAAGARRLIDRLRLRRLLDGGRGRPPADLDALCDAAARLSVLAHALGPAVAAIDLNPVIARRDGCIAVDALVLPAGEARPADAPAVRAGARGG